MVDKKITDLIENMRELRFDLANSSNILMTHKDINYEDLISNMIEKYPQIWGIGGTLRPWLERYATGLGIDHDEGLPSDNGPFNEQ